MTPEQRHYLGLIRASLIVTAATGRPTAPSVLEHWVRNLDLLIAMDKAPAEVAE
jgi:hypothetical protein